MFSTFFLLLAVISVATVQSWSFNKPAMKIMKNIVTVAASVNIALLASGSPAFADAVPAVGTSTRSPTITVVLQFCSAIVATLFFLVVAYP